MIPQQWSEAERDHLHALWGTMPASAIAAELSAAHGRPFTRFAVIGKAHREWLPEAPNFTNKDAPKKYTPEMDAIVRELQPTVCPWIIAKVIGNKTGVQVSESSVRKRAKRLGLVSVGYRFVGRPKGPKKERRPAVKRKTYEVTPIEGMKFVSLGGRGSGECCYPVGEATGRNQLYCGLPKADGFNYCGGHRAVMYNYTPEKLTGRPPLNFRRAA